jgi:hypothetical protein
MFFGNLREEPQLLQNRTVLYTLYFELIFFIFGIMLTRIQGQFLSSFSQGLIAREDKSL